MGINGLGSSRDATGTPYVNTGHPSSGNVDAFARLRVSQPFSLMDTVHQYDLSPLFWDKITASGGTVTHQPSSSSASLSVTTTSGSSAKFQTHNYLRYQPGKSHVVLATGVLGLPKTNVVKRVGYYDDSNGVFFEVAGDGLSVVRRSNTTGSVVDSRVLQAQFNHDKLDGTGPSGLVLDLTKAQIFCVDLQWLSVGRVRYGFEIEGEFVCCHIAHHANLLSVPYMATANLPVRYEVTNTGTSASATSIVSICATVMSEGGREEFGVPATANTGTTVPSITGASLPALSIKPKLTFNSLVNRGLLRISEITSVTDNNVVLELWLNATLSGASWQDVDATNSMAQYDKTATSMTGGTKLYSAIISGSNKGTATVDNTPKLGKILASINGAGDTSDVFTVAFSKVTTNAAVSLAINWTEFR